VSVDGIIRMGAQIGGCGLVESIFHEYGLRLISMLRIALPDNQKRYQVNCLVSFTDM